MNYRMRKLPDAILANIEERIIRKMIGSLASRLPRNKLKKPRWATPKTRKTVNLEKPKTRADALLREIYLSGGAMKMSEVRGVLRCANAHVAPLVRTLEGAGLIKPVIIRTSGRPFTRLVATDAGIAKLREAAA